jgi:amino acid adenylation domain-containing protein
MLTEARLDELLGEVCRRFPDRIAVHGPGGPLSYSELWDRAGRLAAHLRAARPPAGPLIGLIAKPGPDLIAGMVAIARAGSGYVVMDPKYPEARLTYLLEDARPAVVLAGPGEQELPKLLGRTVIPLDAWLDPLAADTATQQPPAASARDVAYVIYTSGTTGAPKGVVVEHRQVTRLFGATQHWFGFDEHDVWTLFHSPSFDFSVWEIWGALLNGGTLVIVPTAARRHPEALLELLTRYQVTVLNQTPSAFRQLLLAEEAYPNRIPGSLRTIVFGGERLDLDLIAGFLRRHPDIELVNMYGITETTVHVTYRKLTEADLDGPAVSPIGVPIPDLTVTIRDPEGRRVPAGEPGEMWIGGAGVARGYLNRPQLTTQRFVTGPDGAVSYRSGDRAALRGGELVYLGRVDDQIKLNGFRIEPAEIEAALLRHPTVTGPVVVTTGTGRNGAAELVALAVPAADASESSALAETWRSHLRRELPVHMRPARYFPVEEIPLTRNGKVDRSAAHDAAARLLAAGEGDTPRRTT